MPDFYPLVRPLLRALSPEAAHRLTLAALAAGLGGSSRAPDLPELRQRLWGLHFPNPIGIAAGFDKDARAPEALLRLGFGFVEIGTVTPRPQSGNAKPRVFRLEADEGDLVTGDGVANRDNLRPEPNLKPGQFMGQPGGGFFV